VVCTYIFKHLVKVFGHAFEMAITNIETKNSKISFKDNSSKKWSYRRVIVFAVCMSLVFWAAIITIMWFLF